MKRRTPAAEIAACAAVTVVPLSAAAVLTVGSESPCWADPERVLEHHPRLTGAFVRLRPPQSVSDAVLARVVDGVRDVARAFRVEGRRRPVTVPSEAGRTLPTAAAAREVVLKLVEEAISSDRDALRELCEEILASAGL